MLKPASAKRAEEPPAPATEIRQMVACHIAINRDIQIHILAGIGPPLIREGGGSQPPQNRRFCKGRLSGCITLSAWSWPPTAWARAKIKS